MIRRITVFSLYAIFLITPVAASAARSFEVSGWIPYWRTATGTADVLPHLDELTEINPFVYTVRADQTLRDNGHLDRDPWKSLIAAAQAQHVRVIPTVMWANGQAIQDTLSNRADRQAFEDTIAETVQQNGFDGVDIDFENKLAETKPYFSLFLKGLSQRLGKKWLTCTIEARTPPQDKFETIPQPLEYANDFKKIGKYCDRVRFMTYDQDGDDLTLNKAHQNDLYAPIADPAWVEKTIRLAARDISKRKIEIGIATYGYENSVTTYADGYTYDILWAFNPRYADQIAQLYGVTSTRAVNGEMSLAYIPTSTAPTLPSSDTSTPNMIPGATSTKAQSHVPTQPLSVSQTAAAVLSVMQQNRTLTAPNSIANAARALASTTNSHTSFHLLWWSDAEAISDKIQLAKQLGVRGVSIFKFDGGEDPRMWDVLRGVKK